LGFYQSLTSGWDNYKKKREHKLLVSETKEEVTTELMDIKRTRKEYYGRFYAHKFDNLHEMDQFLERQNLSKLTQEEIENLNWLLSSKETESIINDLPNQKAGPDRLTCEFYRTFKEKII